MKLLVYDYKAIQRAPNNTKIINGNTYHRYNNTMKQ